MDMGRQRRCRSIVGKAVDAVKEFAATVSECAPIKPEPVKSDVMKQRWKQTDTDRIHG